MDDEKFKDELRRIDEEFEAKASRRKKQYAVILAIIVAMVGLVAWERSIWRPFFPEAEWARIKAIFNPNSVSAQLDILKYCNSLMMFDCAERKSEKLLKLEPSNPRWLSNLGLAQAQQQKYLQAKENLGAAIKLGTYGYDVLGWYAKSLEMVGEKTEAIRWYYRTLELVPQSVDSAESLAALLATDNRQEEALSLLGNLSNQYPNMEPYLRAKRIWIENQMTALGTSPRKLAAMKVPAFKKGHFFLPASFRSTGKPYIFMVDTGASSVLINQKMADDEGIIVPPGAPKVRILLGEGGTIMPAIRLKEIYIGPWKFENVEAFVCPSECPPLLGMSVLSRLKFQQNEQDGVRFLEFSHPVDSKDGVLKK